MLYNNECVYFQQQSVTLMHFQINILIKNECASEKMEKGLQFKNVDFII